MVTTGFIQKVFLGVILLVVLFAGAAQILPNAQSAGDELSDEGQCNVLDTCTYNTTASSSQPCRTSTNHSQVCAQGQPDGVPLASLLGGNGVVFLAIMAGLVLLVVVSTLRLRKR